MVDSAALRQYRDEPMFRHWAPHVSDDRIVAATESVKQLVDDILALGADPDENDVRAAVTLCVERFNDLDTLHPESWIFTIEREDIGEVLWKVIDLAGFAGDEDWFDGRDY